MIIHIQTVEVKTTTTGAAYKVVTAQEGKFSFFAQVQKQAAPGYDLAINGAIIDAVTEDKPGAKAGTVYHNIVSAKPATGQPSAPAAGQVSNGGGNDYQLIERASYEAQTAYKGIIELAIAGKVPADRMSVLIHALAWADAKLNSSLQTNDGDVPF